MQYEHFISENVAPPTARRIGIRNSNGDRVGFIPLGNLAFPDVGQKLYTFGALADVHVVWDTCAADFQRALQYFNSVGVDFICVAGDLADIGTDERLAEYTAIVDAHSPNTPVYACAGNHDAYDVNYNLRPEAVVSAAMLTATGKPLYYFFEQGNDVFIFVGMCEGTFSTAELQWLYETLEANRNKRCFLFQHVFAPEGCGDAFGLYYPDFINNTMGDVFKSLLRHYHNVIWFHAHSHTKFHGQEYNAMANYDNVFGCHSIHIPSIGIPRTDFDGDGDFQIEYAGSEGYVVDVYSDGIHLRGRDFVKGEFLPIASYWLDTTLQTIPAGTYSDSTGTITT